jgi:hypothetical protein
LGEPSEDTVKCARIGPKECGELAATLRPIVEAIGDAQLGRHIHQVRGLEPHDQLA